MKQKRLIDISPAILETKLSEFERELDIYTKVAQQIDIDINVANDLFEGEVTVGIPKVCQLVKKTVESITFGIHLMVTKPEPELVKFLEHGVENRCMFYIHQETKIGSIMAAEYRTNIHLGISVQVESSFRGIEFYSQFDEVQLMTVHTGYQGGKFEYDVLSRVDILRKGGYKGKISIDGGVNLKTAPAIKLYDLDRVSVGSYFSKSKNFELDWQKLDLALNMK